MEQEIEGEHGSRSRYGEGCRHAIRMAAPRRDARSKAQEEDQARACEALEDEDSRTNHGSIEEENKRRSRTA
eukprot:760357-Hanusia_phi.AAC.1